MLVAELVLDPAEALQAKLLVEDLLDPTNRRAVQPMRQSTRALESPNESRASSSDTLDSGFGACSAWTRRGDELGLRASPCWSMRSRDVGQSSQCGAGMRCQASRGGVARGARGRAWRPRARRQNTLRGNPGREIEAQFRRPSRRKTSADGHRTAFTDVSATSR